MGLAELRLALEALYTYCGLQLDMRRMTLAIVRSCWHRREIGIIKYCFHTMIQILEIGAKGELLQHFFPKCYSFVCNLLMKRKTGYITHYEVVYKKLIKIT
jgi:hypothetical protein